MPAYSITALKGAARSWSDLVYLEIALLCFGHTYYLISAKCCFVHELREMYVKSYFSTTSRATR
jgi:hypothetical protein